MHFKLFCLVMVAAMIISLTSALPFPQPGSSVVEVAATENYYQGNGQLKGRINIVNKRSDEADEADENDNENDFEFDFGGEA